MTTQDPNTSNAEDNRVFKLSGELKSELAFLKQRKAMTVEDLKRVVLDSVFPVLSEMAHYLSEHTSMIYELADAVDGEPVEGTQFTEEDARKFELVLTYAKGCALESLKSPDITAGSDEHKKLSEIASVAEECLRMLEENTNVADDEEGAVEIDVGT